MKKIIIDTDLGDDIDDIYSICYALSSGFFDVKLMSICFADINYKLKVAELMLKQVGVNIPLVRGVQYNTSNIPHDVSSIADKNYPDAVDAIAAEVERGTDTIVAIGPLNNIAAFVAKYPNLQKKCRVVLMGGSIKEGYLNQTEPCAEFNIQMAPAALDTLLKSGFEVVMAPLDACRDFIIDGENFAKLRRSQNRFAKTALKFYDEWQLEYWGGAIKYDGKVSSGILYDMIPFLYLADSKLFDVQQFKIICTDEGRTIMDKNGVKISALMGINKPKALELTLKGFEA